MSRGRSESSYITVFDGTTPHHVLVVRSDVTRVFFRMGRDNSLSVTAPFMCTDEQIVAFVSQHIASFASKKKMREKNAKIDIARRILAKDGVTYELKPIKCASARNERMEFLNDACYVHVTALTEERIALVVKDGYLQLARKQLPAVLKKWSMQTGVDCQKLLIKWVTGKWGHWQTKDRTMLLAAQLVSYGPAIVDYVVVHELAHALHPNHSKSFWAQVREWYGDYESARRQLRDEDL